MQDIEIQHLTRSFGSLRALDDVTLQIEAGEWVAITGPSGSGKSTLLNVLAGLDRPTEGSVRVDGTDIVQFSPRELALYRRQSVGLVFQQFHLIPYLNAVENVMLAQYVHSMADRDEAEDALRRVGLGDRLHHLPRELSGGEQQRVCIARALINQPPLLLADEPTGNLDAVNEALVMTLLSDLHAEGHTLLLVTHDPTIASRADREVPLDHGRIVQPAAMEEAERPAFLATVWNLLEEEGRTLSVDRPGVARAMSDGLLAFSDGRLGFTGAGRSAALQAVRRFRLAEALMKHTLDRSQRGACGDVTPLASDAVDEVDAFLGYPTECPHGRPIPRPARAESEPQQEATG